MKQIAQWEAIADAGDGGESGRHLVEVLMHPRRSIAFPEFGLGAGGVGVVANLNPGEPKVDGLLQRPHHMHLRNE